MTLFPKMADILTPAKAGPVEIKHVTVSPKDAEFTRLREAVTGGRDTAVPEGTYAHLYVHGQLMMSDTPMEKRSNSHVLCVAAGDVLIAGLGLGMILHPLLAKPEVRSVTVVEKYQEVIDLVGPTLPKEKLSLVHGDIFTWQPEKGRQWDTIYFDIWPDVSPDNLEEMTTLHRRFARRKTGSGWMDSWMKDTLKARAAREKRQSVRRGW